MMMMMMLSDAKRQAIAIPMKANKEEKAEEIDPKKDDHLRNSAATAA
jgi:hypothetical protein